MIEFSPFLPGTKMLHEILSDRESISGSMQVKFVFYFYITYCDQNSVKTHLKIGQTICEFLGCQKGPKTQKLKCCSKVQNGIGCFRATDAPAASLILQINVQIFSNFNSVLFYQFSAKVWLLFCWEGWKQNIQQNIYDFNPPNMSHSKTWCMKWFYNPPADGSRRSYDRLGY